MGNHFRGMRHVTALHTDEHKPRHEVFKSYHAPDQHSRVLGKVKRKQPISPIESAYVLQEGNKSHARRLSEFDGELPEKINTLMLICADSRMGGMFDFDDFTKRGVAVVYVAGNVSEFLHAPGIKEILKRMDKDSSIFIMGHAKCGAVHCAAEMGLYAELRNIAILLSLVKPTGELDNLHSQKDALVENPDFQAFAAKKNIRVLTAFADISHDTPHIRLVDDGMAKDEDRELIHGIDSNFRKANAGQDLSAHQFAHAVVIYGPSLPFDAREIFSANANQIFCVSAGDFGGDRHKGKLSEESVASAEMAALGLLDEHSVASVEYSITKNNTRHIMLLHTDLAVIDMWEKDLLKKSDIVRDAIISGDLEVTTAVYDSSTGRVTMVRHLVNENAASAIESKLP